MSHTEVIGSSRTPRCERKDDSSMKASKKIKRRHRAHLRTHDPISLRSFAWWAEVQNTVDHSKATYRCTCEETA